jgi:molybdopterin/thiamine biosynthesis adenylyltransferase/rhodanese-related sulfurtransferase/molybdopterin converting factor small subunit
MPKILIPSALRQYAEQQAEVELQGATVGELLEELAAKYPELRRHLFTAEGKLRSFVNIYVNEEDIRYLQREQTAVTAADTISIVPSIAGGAAVAETAAGLSREEILRYSRHLIMPEVAMEGQLKLKQARVLVVGAGGLGSPLALYLAAAGVGRLGLVDYDVVDLTNLQRQILYATPDVGRKKLEVAIERLRTLNPEIQVEGYETALTSENALEILRDYDIVVDGTDNFPTRYLVNDACVLLGKPNVYGSIFRFEGQATVFAMPGGPCYRCLYPEPPPPGLVPSCAEGGVLGILPGLIGLIQATETVKLILGTGRPLVGRLVLYDALAMRFRELKLRRDPNCPVCGDRPTIRALIDYEQFCGVRRERGMQEADDRDLEPRELEALMARGERFLLLDVREPHEHRICSIPGARLIPLKELPQRLHELDSAERIIVHCRSGQRSAKAVKLLREAGFRHVQNLKGGILAWSDQVDPSVPKY